MEGGEGTNTIRGRLLSNTSSPLDFTKLLFPHPQCKKRIINNNNKEEENGDANRSSSSHNSTYTTHSQYLNNYDANEDKEESGSFNTTTTTTTTTTNLVYSPTYTIYDINQQSNEWTKLSKFTQQHLITCIKPRNILGTTSSIGLCMAPEDLCFYEIQFLHRLFNISSPYNSSWHIFDCQADLDRTDYCQSVTRHDLELVASTIAKTHSCDYCEVIHETFREASSLSPSSLRSERRSTSIGTSSRKDVLENFGRIVASVPLNSSMACLALEKVDRVGGEELVVEAIAVAAVLESQTRVLHGTGRARPNPKNMKRLHRIMQILLTYRRYHLLPKIIMIVVLSWFLVLLIW